MAATDLHASIMLDAIVLRGRARKGVMMFTVPTHGIRPQRCFFLFVFLHKEEKVVMKGVSVHCQIDAAPL